MIEELGASDQSGRKFLFLVPDSEEFQGQESRGNVTVQRVALGPGGVRLIRRFWFEVHTFPRIVRRQGARLAIVLGNYSIRALPCPKVVMVRHPYLLGAQIPVERMTLRRRLEEKLRKLAFYLTVRASDRWLVQSQQMRTQLEENWGIPSDRIQVVGNPVSKVKLPWQESPPTADNWGVRLFYPSRYYEHKNHELLIEFADQERDFLKEKGIRFVITLDPSGQGGEILSRIQSEGLTEYFENLGEVPHGSLLKHYGRMDFVVFPSIAETFGNGIVEGMCAGLPIIASDRPYAHTLCGGAAVYFEPTDPCSLKEAIEKALKNREELLTHVAERRGGLVSVQEWVDQVVPPVSESFCRTNW
jgi:glycosyltransferase involved in cell wall biosynthesis